MKRTAICFLLVFLLLLPLSSCIRIGGAGDWTFDLPGGYTVVRVNNLCIKVIKDRATVVGEYIEAFCFGETYVGVKRIPFDFESGRHEDIDHVPTAYPDTEREYYLLDTASGTLYGPYTAEEFTARCEELTVTDLCDWISTDGWPDGAHD
jgi:hypothetical protein